MQQSFLNYRNVAKHIWREPQIIKFENAFHIWINIGYICERTLSAMPRVKSRVHARLTDCNLQSQLHCAVTPSEQNFTKLVRSRQHQASEVGVLQHPLACSPRKNGGAVLKNR